MNEFSRLHLFAQGSQKDYNTFVEYCKGNWKSFNEDQKCRAKQAKLAWEIKKREKRL